MTSKAIDFPAGDLAGRHAAVPFRIQAAALIRDGVTIRFNLGGVLSLTGSYADELFGVLTREFGLALLRDRIVLINASEPVLKAIAEAIARRSEERGEDPLKLANG